MFTEFFLKNAFNLAILFSCGMALLVVRFWLSRNVQWKKGFTFHAAQFFIYAIIIGTIGSILNNAIEDYNLRFISSGVIDFICTSLIALILTIKLFLIINQFEKAQVNKGRDVTSTRILARVIKITIIVAIVLLYGEHFGMSLVRSADLWRYRRYRCWYGGQRCPEQFFLRYYALFRSPLQYRRLDSFS